MARMGAMIVPGARLGLKYAQKLLAGVNDENYARFAAPGGVQIHSNHPAFVLGHLSLYSSRAMYFLHLPLGPTAYPPSYETLFRSGVECRDDPHFKIYPPLGELKSYFFEGYEAAFPAIDSAADEFFNSPNPAEGRTREVFPTVGAALNFYMIGHVQVHLGQFSTWRRAMGLAPL